METRLSSIFLIGLLLAHLFFCQNAYSQANTKIPVVVVSDLYFPAQDPGDNFDLITAYALPQINLKAVILDCTEPYRQPIAINPGEGLFPDPNGPREAGYIPLLQLNYIFDRTVPFASSPFTKMKDEYDKMLNIPKFQQQGIELLIESLRKSDKPIQIVSFGSARVLAVAYNREPKLFKKKVARIHLSAGASGADFLEWNVALDRNAIITLLKSNLPIALYPCAADKPNGMAYGSYNYPFSYDKHNTYYKLPNLNFVRQMNTALQRYLAFSFTQSPRKDFLRAVENDSLLNHSVPNYNNEHYVWETAIWLNVAKLKIVYTKEGKYRILAENKISSEDLIITNELQNCKVKLIPNGYIFETTKERSNFSIFYRKEPYLYEKAMQEALPDLYINFKIK